MSCFPELTYSVFVDGELPPHEARLVEAHLLSCPHCFAIVQALQVENQLLTQILAEANAEGALVAPPVVERPTRPIDILWTALAVLTAAIGLQVAWSLVSGFEAPTGANWLNPFSLTAQWKLLFNSLFYFIQEGAVMLFSNVVAISGMVTTLLGIGAVAYWLRRRPSTVSVLATIAVLATMASPAQAIETRQAKRVTIAADEVVEDTLVLTAEAIQVDGTVNGSLIAFCGKTTINGTVTGDVITFTEILEVNGTVEGNVFAFTESANVGGRVAGLLVAFAQRVNVASGGTVGGDVLAFTGDASIDGTVERDVMAFAGMTSLTGTVGRHLKARTGQLSLSSSARVGGDLRARVKTQDKVEIDPAATVAGETKIKLPSPRPSKFLRPKWYFWQAVCLAAAFLTGLLLYWLFPFLYQSRLETAKSVLLDIIWGFVTLVTVPIAAIILAITVVGLPVSLISLAIWGAALYFAHILVAAFLGRSLLTDPEGTQPAFALPLLLGLLILKVSTSIPYIGGWLGFLVLLLGLGMAVTKVHDRWRAPQPA